MSKSITKGDINPVDAATIVSALRDQYAKWLPVRGESRRLLYAMLGDIHAAIPIVEADNAEHQKLRDLVREDENVRASKRFDPWKADSLNLFLVGVLSLKEETRATKSQWRSVLFAASLENVPPSSEAFQDWIRAKGGIVEVLRGDRAQISH